MSNQTYIRVLQKAYFLELLGEETYRHGSRKIEDRVASEQWCTFAETEAQMQALLRQELERLVGGRFLSGSATRVARWLGRLAGVLGPALLTLAIRRLLDQRRYSRWAAQFGSQNPDLWRALVWHELRQVDHFEGRRT